MYTPNPIVKDNLELYVNDELHRVSGALEAMEVDHIRYKIHYAEPSKPRAGDEYYADGTTWNPGGTGEGLYRYNLANSWVKIG